MALLLQLVTSKLRMSNYKFGKVETHFEIKAGAERFYDVFLNRPHHIPNMITSQTREKLPSVDINDDDHFSGGKVGTQVSWNYIQGILYLSMYPNIQ